MKSAQNICPKCGATTSQKELSPLTPVAFQTSAENLEQDRDYDHRGIQMPRRTRVGGIIVPQ